MGIRSLDRLDDRERSILSCIFQFQIEDEKGVSWGKLLDLIEITNKMSRQTFSLRLKALTERGLIEKEIINDERGKPTFYRLESKLFNELKEHREFLSWNLEKAIHDFDKDIESFSTPQYVEGMMELANGILDSSIILLTVPQTDGAKWMLYESTYKNIEVVFRKILKRAIESQEDKKQTLVKLFEILEPLSQRPIGKRFGFGELYDLRRYVIKSQLEQT